MCPHFTSPRSRFAPGRGTTTTSAKRTAREARFVQPAAPCPAGSCVMVVDRPPRRRPTSSRGTSRAVPSRFLRHGRCSMCSTRGSLPGPTGPHVVLHHVIEVAREPPRTRSAQASITTENRGLRPANGLPMSRSRPPPGVGGGLAPDGPPGWRREGGGAAVGSIGLLCGISIHNVLLISKGYGHGRGCRVASARHQRRTRGPCHGLLLVDPGGVCPAPRRAARCGSRPCRPGFTSGCSLRTEAASARFPVELLAADRGRVGPVPRRAARCGPRPCRPGSPSSCSMRTEAVSALFPVEPLVGDRGRVGSVPRGAARCGPRSCRPGSTSG